MATAAAVDPSAEEDTPRAGANILYLLALALPVCLLLQRQTWVVPHTGLGVGLGTVCALASVGAALALIAGGGAPAVLRFGPVPLLLLVWLIAVLASYLAWAMNGIRLAALLADLAMLQFVLEAIFVLALTGALVPGQRLWTFLKVLAACGAGYGALLLITSVTGTEVSDMLRFPLLEVQGALSGVESERGGFIRSQGMAGHPLEAGAVAAALVPVSFGLMRGLRSAGRPWRWWALATALTALGAVSTLSRSVTVALAVAFFLMALRWPPRVIVGALGAVVLGILAAAAVVPDRVAAYIELFGSSSQTDSSLFSRQAAREHVAHVLQNTFWTGEGLGTQQVLGRPILDNQYLKFAVELGVPSTLAFLALLGFSIYYLLHRAGALPGPLREVALGIAGSLGVIAVVLSILDAFAFPQIRMLTYVLLALVGVVAAVSGRAAAATPTTAPAAAPPANPTS